MNSDPPLPLAEIIKGCSAFQQPYTIFAVHLSMVLMHGRKRKMISLKNSALLLLLLLFLLSYSTVSLMTSHCCQMQCLHAGSFATFQAFWSLISSPLAVPSLLVSSTCHNYKNSNLINKFDEIINNELV